MGGDIAVDIRLLSRLIEGINADFGLIPEQIDKLHLKLKLLTLSDVKLVSKNAKRLVPIAGQIVSAAIGFSAFRAVGNRHIESCFKVAEELFKGQAEGE